MAHQDPGAWSQVINQGNALLALFGAMGGAVRSAALKTTWKEGLRVTFIGAVLSFGVGSLGPFVLRPWIGELPAGSEASLGTLCSAAFIVGLLGVTLIERFLDGKGLRDAGQ